MKGALMDEPSTHRHCDADVDDAIATVEASRTPSGEIPVVAAVPIDNVHPWWFTFRLPLTIISISLLLFSVSLTTLAVLALMAGRDDAREDVLRDCREAYESEVFSATARTRLTTARLTNSFNTALLEIIREGSVESVDPEALARGITDNEQSIVRDSAAVEAWDAWVAAGEPLPCPLTSGR